MCHRCEANAMLVLASMFTKGVTSARPDDPAQAEKVAQTNTQLADLGLILHRAYPEVRSDDPVPDGRPIIHALMQLGAERTGEAVKLAGFMMQALATANMLGVAAMEGMAKSGNLPAAAWLRDNADHIARIESLDLVEAVFAEPPPSQPKWRPPSNPHLN